MMLMSLVIVPIGIATVVFWIWALVDCLLRPEERYEKMFGTISPKLVWVLIIFFGQLIGAIIYVVVAGTRKNPKWSSVKVDSAGTEEGKRILQMIADGKVTPEEGQRLLVALGKKESNTGKTKTDMPFEFYNIFKLYTMVMSIIGVTILMYFIVFIVPRFGSVYNDLGAKLPGLTQWLLTLSTLKVPIVIFGGILISLIFVILQNQYVERALQAKFIRHNLVVNTMYTVLPSVILFVLIMGIIVIGLYLPLNQFK